MKDKILDVLDKESGIITSKSISFRNSFTYERKGVRDNYNAYVAVPYNNSLTYIEDVTGRVYVRVRKVYSGTEITVFLQNLSARMRIDDYLWTGQSQWYNAEAGTTGVLETLIQNVFKD